MAQHEDPTTTAPASAGSGEGRDPVTLILAIYGAAVASGVAIYQFVRDRPGVRLFMFSLISLQLPGGEHVYLWGVRIVNHRKRPITIRSGGLLNGKTRRYPTFLNRDGVQVNQPWPIKLDDGEAFEFFAHREAEGDEATGAWVTDSLDRVYKVRHPTRRPIARFKTWRLRRAAESR